MRLASPRSTRSRLYAHFDVVKEGEVAPPRHGAGVRILSCAMVGAEQLLRDLPARLGADVRVVRAPCMAPATRTSVCGRPRAGDASGRMRMSRRPRGEAACTRFRDTNTFDAYTSAGGYALLKACLAGTRTRDDIIKAVSDSGLRGLGGAGFRLAGNWVAVCAPTPRRA